jgi:hypothetical protein
MTTETRELVERLATEAGMNLEYSDAPLGPSLRGAIASKTALLRFAALVAGECAKLCALESVVLATRDQTRGALHCATAIRERFGIEEW